MGAAIFFRPTGKGRARKGGRRRNGTVGGQREGNGGNGNGEEGNGEEETVGRTGVRQKAEKARKGKMAEERKGNKKMWSQGRNCRRGT